MIYWLRGQRGGLCAFLAITTLVAGGLGWATGAALRLEREQREARAQAELYQNLRLALWRLDGRVSPVLAREDARPYQHFSAVFAPPLALRPDFSCWPAGEILQVSPLLNEDLPDWVVLHFQEDPAGGWTSPQVLPRTVAQRLAGAHVDIPATDMTRRAQVLHDLTERVPAKELLSCVEQKGAQSRLEDATLLLAGQDENSLLTKFAPQQARTAEYLMRSLQQNRVKLEGKAGSAKDASKAVTDMVRNGDGLFDGAGRRPPRTEQVAVSLGSMTPLWLSAAGAKRLFVVRLVHLGGKEVCQGLVLDWPRLQEVLAQEVEDLFTEVEFRPVHADPLPHPERTMTALPVELDPGPGAVPVPAAEWTPLRIGLSLAWAAALVALAAVGLGGWSLIDLSERRIRFVSAVTHELRTPLTTLRLYLDMMTGGIVKEDKQKAEYLQTLHVETERLNRLVSNVLDFSRLENQRPRLERSAVAVAELLEQVRATWHVRCAGVEKELVVDNQLGEETLLLTDGRLVQQVLGNLIDNACKYSRGAADRRIWLRARPARRQRLVFEVADCGPGVARRERRTIFRAFRRGRGTEVTGGVGLGLALARRWAHLLGGRLGLHCAPEHTGACFQLELPLA
jgi:signal transduction histidine kinase